MTIHKLSNRLAAFTCLYIFTGMVQRYSRSVTFHYNPKLLSIEYEVFEVL
jgi:hypothetical protein